MNKVSQTELITLAKAGNVVSFPTDTVPALAVIPEKSQLIFNLKQRPQNKPLILMGANAEDLWAYIAGSQEEKKIWQAVMNTYWPGALTLVLPSSKKVPPAMNLSEPDTIGVRVPKNILARSILAATGPLATTSANISGAPPLESMTAIASNFSGVFVLNCPNNEEKLGLGVPSTVAKWTLEGWQILRQGNLTIRN